MGGAVAARPVHPECPDASSGCIEGPAQPSVWGRADARIGDRVARALRYASVKAPALLRVSGLGRSPIVFATGRACDLWTITVHACYYIRVITTPDAPTIHYQLSTMEHPCPILFRTVPRQIRNVGHRLSHFSEKCLTAQIGMGHFGTEWDTSHGESTTPLRTRAVPARPVERLRLVAIGADPAGLRDIHHHPVGSVVLRLDVRAVARSVHP